MNNVDFIYDKIGYKFKDEKLLDIALTHSSYANESGVESYERLEFLGDAVIELIVSDYILKFEELDAGILTKLRASLVSTDNLAKISTMLSVMQIVKKSRSLNTFSKKNTADIFESLIGAIYLDGGIMEAQKVVNKYVIIDDNHISEMLKSATDYKTKFQEDMQRCCNAFEYKLLSSEGMDHNKTFQCGLYINGELITQACGKSIHMAEEECAKLYYETKADK